MSLHCIIPVIVLSLFLTTGHAVAGKLDQIKARGELIAGVKDSEAPFGFIDEKSNQIEGFDIDICRYLAQRLGVKLTLKPVTNADRQSVLLQGAADLVAAALEHNFQRDDAIDFSITYFQDGLQLLAHKDAGIVSVADLSGKKIAVLKGSGTDKIVKSSQPHAIVLHFDGYPQAFMAVKRGEAAAVCAHTVVLLGLKYNDEKPDTWNIFGDYLEVIYYGLGLPENDSDFRDAVNKALVEMWKSGEFEKVYDKWFGAGAKYPLPLTWKPELWP